MTQPEKTLSSGFPHWSLTSIWYYLSPHVTLSFTFKPLGCPIHPHHPHTGIMGPKSNHSKYFSYLPEATPPASFPSSLDSPSESWVSKPYTRNLLLKCYGFNWGSKYSSFFHSQSRSFSLDLCSSTLGDRQWIWRGSEVCGCHSWSWSWVFLSGHKMMPPTPY